MFNQTIEAKQEKSIGLHTFTATLKNINLHRVVTNNFLGMDANNTPCGKPAERESAAPWTTTNGTLRPGSRRVEGREMSCNPSILFSSFWKQNAEGRAFLSEWVLEYGFSGWQLEDIHIRRHFRGSEELTDFSYITQFSFTQECHTACNWQMQDWNLSPLTLTLRPFAWPCWKKYTDTGSEVRRHFLQARRGLASSIPWHMWLFWAHPCPVLGFQTPLIKRLLLTFETTNVMLRW